MPGVALVNVSSASSTRPRWVMGPQRTCQPTAASLARVLGDMTTETDAVLCLDDQLPVPDHDLLSRLLDGPSDVWHGGLRLGTAGRLDALQHVNPQWTLGLAAPPDVESTSWELSLRALLVRRAVLEQLGGPDPAMETLTGAGLELGLRWIRAGALVRHVPGLAPADSTQDGAVSHRDQFRALACHHGRVWAGWALGRAVMHHRVPVATVPALARVVRVTEQAPTPAYAALPRTPGDRFRTVTVVIPTLNRYSYLGPLLHQLARQTVPPHEVIVVDQSPPCLRRSDLAAVEPNLPTTVLGLDRPGQSTARNIALRRATGDMVLFIDDDDDVGPTLLADHLERLTEGIDGICGGVDDATAGPPPSGFRHRRASDVFPTNNTMLRRCALQRSGLFDPVFDHGPRADRDLGIRLHLGGALLVYDPSVMVFHHHAPVGGLRTHGARKVTRASARRSLTERNLPATTELYLGRRYFTPLQQREARAVRVLSILSGGGSPRRRLARVVVQLALLPDTVAKLRSRDGEAGRLLAGRSPIPGFNATEGGEPVTP